MEIKENQQIIEQVITLPKKSKEENDIDFKLFRDNLDLILENTDLIINNPELFHTSFNRTSINLAYLGGNHAPLGVLLQLWRDGILVDECNVCSGKLYIFCAGGSPLSGSNGCIGICGACKAISKKSLPSTGPIIKSLECLKANLNKRKILRTKSQYFSWKNGLTGEVTPDEIIEEGVTPADMEELIFRLKKNYDT